MQRQIKGHFTWYAQLIQEGLPYLKGKNKIKDGVERIDIGPSSIAVVGSNKASLQEFCAEVYDARKNSYSPKKNVSLFKVN